MQPLISVVMPVYNCVNRINFMIDSLARQTYQNIELIIVDDGSTDGTSDAIHGLSGISLPPREIVILSDGKNHGVSWARNKGLEAANGEYVIFVDADDILETRFLECLFSNLTNANADYAACGFRKYTLKNHKYKDYPLAISKNVTPQELLISSLIGKGGLDFLWVILFKREFLLKNNLWSHVGCSATQDRELIVKVLASLGHGVFIPDCLYVYVQHDGMNSRPSAVDKAKRRRRYHDQAYAELREANYVLRRFQNEKICRVARSWLKASAFHKILALYAMTGNHDRFEALVKKKPLRRLLWSNIRYFFLEPELVLKNMLVLIFPRMFYAHYSDEYHSLK